jgi:hypothetical protein
VAEFVGEQPRRGVTIHDEDAVARKRLPNTPL